MEPRQMTIKVSEDRYKEITGNAETQALRGIWSQLGDDTSVFSCKRELFLWILNRLLREHRIKLHKRGVFLTGSVEEQVEAFRRALPTTEEDADRQCTLPGREPAYPEFGMNVWWFFIFFCPAGVAWRRSDGSYVVDD